MYKIGCKNCDAIYIGKKGNALEKRLKEHRYTVNKRKQPTGLAEHCFVDDQNFIDVNIIFLHFVDQEKCWKYTKINRVYEQ